MSEDKPCRICGKAEEDHHPFERATPVGCVCDAKTWSNAIASICDKYVGNGITYCSRCEHDAACHKKE